MKASLITLIMSLCAAITIAQTNLILNPGFENNVDGKIPAEIKNFNAASNNATVNDKEYQADFEQGKWMSVHFQDKDVSVKVQKSEKYEGEYALEASIGSDIPQRYLNQWYNCILFQYVPIDKTKRYVLKFHAKGNLLDFKYNKIFVALEVHNKTLAGQFISGSADPKDMKTWASTSKNMFQEFTYVFDPTEDSSFTQEDYSKRSKIIFAIRSNFNTNIPDKTSGSVVYIDNVRFFALD